MELEYSSEEQQINTLDIEQRRRSLEAQYAALPAFGSAGFWSTIEETDPHLALPLELLVRCVRNVTAADTNERNRIVEIILYRTQGINEAWAKHALSTIPIQSEERTSLVHDLYADLCETLIRAILDPQRPFWEEHFMHCLRFERRHVFQGFLTREGHWFHPPQKKSKRIPRTMMESISQPARYELDEVGVFDIEDVRAQDELLAIERKELPRVILRLPDKLKSVVLLIYWDGRTEKDVAQVLGITDRTVRNRLREAFKLLRSEIGNTNGRLPTLSEKGAIYIRESVQEESLLPIISHYIAEVEAGRYPSLSHYLAQYPHSADALSAFISYYHAIEADL